MRSTAASDFMGFVGSYSFSKGLSTASHNRRMPHVTINHYDYLFVSDKSESNGIFLRKHFTLTDKYLLFYSVYLIVVRGGS